MKRSLAFAVAITFLGACSTKEIDIQNPLQYDTVFYASFEQPSDIDTKVYANDDLLLRWTTDDRVSIFNNLTYNQEYKFTGQTGANAGGFKKVDNDEFVTGNAISHVVSVYPYQEATSISEDEVINLTLPAEQVYAVNTFGLGANTMVSVSEDNVLQYKNVGGYLMLKLYGEGVSVSSITLKGNNGEKLAGKAMISMPLDGVPSVNMSNDASTEISLKCETPVRLGSTEENYTQFWFVVPPVTFNDGFSIIVKDNKNGVFEKTSTKELVINRNTLSKMAVLKTEIEPQEITQPLTFEAIEDGVLTFNNPLGLSIEYSSNGEEWTSATSTIEIEIKAGEYLLFRGNNESYSSGQYSTLKTSTFLNSAPCYIYGNIMSLLDSENYSNLKEIKQARAFNYLFQGNKGLRSHPEKELLLPATTLSEECYGGLFSLCEGLTRPPKLPARSLTSYCYSSMFYGCTGLAEAPELPSTSLAEGCYTRMFTRCTSITAPPQLPATSLSIICYSSMFDGCSSLQTVPELPATKLSLGCYQCMFMNCTSLTETPSLEATELAENCYQGMFSGCAKLESIPSILPATTLAEKCYRGMFEGCTSIQSAPILPAEILEKYAYSRMFAGCSSLSFIKAMFLAPGGALEQWVEGVAESGTFIKNEKSTWEEQGIIPEGWQVFREGAASDINVLTYMSHTKGEKSVPLVILPDGYVKDDLPHYRARAIDCIETLFSVEPFKSYRDYFSVYIIEIPSVESGASITDGQGNISTRVNNYFETRWGASSYSDMRANETKVQQIASLCPDILNGDHQLWHLPIAVLVNDTRYGGICISDNLGYAYCIIPYAYSGEPISWSYPGAEAASNIDDSQGYRTVPSSEISEMGICYGNWMNIFVHEFGGHAFGRLTDEYWYGKNAASTPSVTGHGFSTPFGLNVSGSYYDVPWQELLDNQQELVSRDPHYSRMGIYQGGDVCMFGRWRNERISCMIDNRLYFSAWQRYLITKRIMTLSGCIDEFSFDSWVSKDNTVDSVRDNRSSNTISSPVSGVVHQEELLLPPVLVER